MLAVVLMTAVVVVGAAGVYVWLSSFGSEPTQPSSAISLSSNEPLVGGVKTYYVPAATAGMKWQDVHLSLDGAVLARSVAPGCPSPAVGEWVACRGSTTRTSADLVGPGDLVKIAASGDEMLRVVDVGSNAILVTVVVR